MKNALLTTLLTGLLFTANASMASSKIEPEQNLPKTSVETTQTEKTQSTEIIDEMVHSKLETQMMHLAAAEKVENCWAWDACIETPASNAHGYDLYTFN